jgi:hypothetical protein
MVLNERREVALILSVNDVLVMRPDLTNDQAWNVLQYIKQNHDAGNGSSWDVIDIIALEMFGPELDSKLMMHSA